MVDQSSSGCCIKDGSALVTSQSDTKIQKIITKHKSCSCILRCRANCAAHFLQLCAQLEFHFPCKLQFSLAASTQFFVLPWHHCSGWRRRAPVSGRCRSRCRLRSGRSRRAAAEPGPSTCPRSAGTRALSPALSPSRSHSGCTEESSCWEHTRKQLFRI